ncbi:MAG: GspE/PulE family protein [bacterium]|nr:GspE/PulE family protein [bacterium]
MNTTNLQDLGALVEQKASGDITGLADALLSGAVTLDASDVHIEPQEEQSQVRLRIDGLLQDAFLLQNTTAQNLLSRIKLMAGLKLNVEDRPQDGRFSLGEKEGQHIEIRAATLPSEHGESLVLRILNPKRLLKLKDLGLREDLLSIFEKELAKPNGMIVVTGPTGSGKTTTLYAFLREVTKPEVKVVTIEDPIEYHLKGISQTQVDESKGYGFASGLRAIVRQDPDVILVGEMRDEETVDIALQASLTGHLVFSTLHTNDAVGTVARLQSLGAKIETVASGLNLIIAQRLVRVLCQTCKEPYAATESELQEVEKAVARLKGKLKPTLEKKLMLYRAPGCKQCNKTGFKGRVGVFEAMNMDSKTEEFILESPSVSSLRQFAVEKGMVEMYQDGILKVLEGVTTLQELQRVATMEE